LTTKFRPAELLVDVQAADWGEIIEEKRPKAKPDCGCRYDVNLNGQHLP
jgi:hypothetical protein